MIKIRLNGKEQNIDGKMSLDEILKSKNIDPASIITVVNLTAVNVKNLDKTFLKEADEVELIRIVAGG
jgi:thiamine biosynthesis protein ThiS